MQERGLPKGLLPVYKSPRESSASREPGRSWVSPGASVFPPTSSHFKVNPKIVTTPVRENRSISLRLWRSQTRDGLMCLGGSAPYQLSHSTGISRMVG